MHHESNRYQDVTKKNLGNVTTKHDKNSPKLPPTYNVYISDKKNTQFL